MKKYKSYKATIIQGSIGDMALDNLGWLSEKDQNEFWENHKKHIAELKEKGEYLKPTEVEITLEHCPLFDEPQPIVQNMESYRYEVLTIGKNE